MVTVQGNLAYPIKIQGFNFETQASIVESFFR